MAITLCHLTDKMISSYLDHLEKRFVEEGGIKERMHAARTGYRQQQDQHMRSLQRELLQMKQQLLEKEAEIEELKRRLGELES